MEGRGKKKTMDKCDKRVERLVGREAVQVGGETDGAGGAWWC